MRSTIVTVWCPNCAQLHKIDLAKFAIKCGFCGKAIKVRIPEMKQDLDYYDKNQRVTPDRPK